LGEIRKKENELEEEQQEQTSGETSILRPWGKSKVCGEVGLGVAGGGKKRDYILKTP